MNSIVGEVAGNDEEEDEGGWTQTKICIILKIIPDEEKFCAKDQIVSRLPKASIKKARYDLTQLLNKLETFLIALNEALFEGYKCPSQVKILKIVLPAL